ncbi:MAG: hypothetical protein VYE35_09770 [Chloroflexota bacterium]|nr:hypothetical protein [Chloroflexota bacterium]
MVKTTKLPGAGVGTAVALGAGTTVALGAGAAVALGAGAAVALGAGTAVALGGADVASGTAVSDPQAITSRIRAATIARIAVDLIMSECLLPK